jgi:hypothetical protein
MSLFYYYFLEIISFYKYKVIRLNKSNKEIIYYNKFCYYIFRGLISSSRYSNL